MLVRLLVVPVLALVLLAAAPSSSATAYPPVRIAAYYPWFPEGWTHANMNPFTHYRPTLGFYDAGDARVITRHVRAMQWGGIRAATYSWWGRGSPTDNRLAQHLDIAARTGFFFAVYYEWEGYDDPSVERIRADLEYLRDFYGSRRGYLQLGGRFVVFVYGDGNDGVGCGAARRWHEANSGVGAYLVLRAFRGFRACATQPSGWHPYSAHKYEFDLTPYAYSISPGFYFAKDARPARRRHLATWWRSVRRMTASPSQFHFVISYNEWGEGTAVESAHQWRSPSGFGRYLDVLHAVRGR